MKNFLTCFVFLLFGFPISIVTANSPNAVSLNDSALIRFFQNYDDSRHLITLTFDDGKGEELQELDGVTMRYFFYLTLSDSGPACGEPIHIEEKQWDPITGQEVLIRTIVNSYSDGGQLLFSDIFDSEGIMTVRLMYEYQDEGFILNIITRSGETIVIRDFAEDNLLNTWEMALREEPQQLTLSRMDTLHDITEYSYQCLRFLAGSINKAVSHIKHEVKRLTDFETYLEDSGHQVIGRTFFVLAGYYGEKTERGVVGRGEVSDKIRLSHINGILNTKQDELESAAMLSRCHGNINVHYTYRSTGGWTHDVFKVTMVRLGYTSLEAYELALSWREMIAEMGGVQGGGMILHYAHSIGGSETLAAKQFLTPEEQQLIIVKTFGSPKLIAAHEFYDVVNYVSYRDGVSLFDPLTYIWALAGGTSNIVFVGDYFGIPAIDHFFEGESYRTVVEKLGRDFVEDYGCVKISAQ